MRRCAFFFLLVLLPFVAVLPQSFQPSLQPSQQLSWEPLFRDWLNLEDADYGEDTFELLSDLAESKLNLNHLSREQLEQLPFLSAQQIEDLMAYADRYKPLRSLSELQMITSLDPATRRLLSCFVCCDTVAAPRSVFPSWAALNEYGHHTLQGTIKIPMYERRGDRDAYLGYRSRHDLRYQFTYRDQVKWGLTAAQDAGEPFFANKNKWGYDFYSYYFQLRRVGRLEALNLGMYRVQMGMGLLMNTGFHLGKLTMLQSLGRNTHVLTAHASRSSGSYLRGAAATLRLTDNWQLTAFASYRPLDATLNDDGTARTIVTDGYHRTESELAKKSNTYLTDLGLRLGWKRSVHGGLASLSVNALYSHFDRSLVPFAASQSSSPTQLYRRYALSGSDFFNASIDYGFTNYRLAFSGETALNRDGALAAVHSLSYRLSDQWALMVLHRYYDKRYTAYHAHSFSEGGGTQNEHGVYVGAKWQPSRTTSLQVYADYAHFPWARYQVSAPSDAFDASLFARTLINSMVIEGRYRFHLRQRDNEDHTFVQNRYDHRARLRLSIPAVGSPVQYAAVAGQPLSLVLATQADAALINQPTESSRGIMLSQQADLRYRWLRLNALVGWFHTDDYDSRLYQYEPSVRYDFSFPMYYGHGLRYALMVRADIGRFMLAAKLGTTNYFDRAVISSGQQQIDRSSMTDLLLQLRCQF